MMLNTVLIVLLLVFHTKCHFIEDGFSSEPADKTTQDILNHIAHHSEQVIELSKDVLSEVDEHKFIDASAQVDHISHYMKHFQTIVSQLNNKAHLEENYQIIKDSHPWIIEAEAAFKTAQIAVQREKKSNQSVAEKSSQELDALVEKTQFLAQEGITALKQNNKLMFGNALKKVVTNHIEAQHLLESICAFLNLEHSLEATESFRRISDSFYDMKITGWTLHKWYQRSLNYTQLATTNIIQALKFYLNEQHTETRDFLDLSSGNLSEASKVLTKLRSNMTDISDRALVLSAKSGIKVQEIKESILKWLSIPLSIDSSAKSEFLTDLSLNENAFNNNVKNMHEKIINYDFLNAYEEMHESIEMIANLIKRMKKRFLEQNTKIHHVENDKVNNSKPSKTIN